jgi:tRNA-dihydrouridine synthase
MIQLSEAPLAQIFGEVQELTARLANLKKCFANEHFNAMLEHYWKLQHLRTRTAEFKWRVQQFEQDNEWQSKHDQDTIQVWDDLKHTLDVLEGAFS